MRVGRNFTNLLELDYVSPAEKRLLKAGKIKVADIDAKYQIVMKKDIVRQVNVAHSLGHEHIELDGGIPNPFLTMMPSEIKRARKECEKMDVTLSMHLPYTFIAESTCCFQESDRKLAVDYLKQYLDVGEKLGIKYVVMHPGRVPFYQMAGEYYTMMVSALTRTMIELGRYASKRNILVHIENNTKFDNIMITPEDFYPVLKKCHSAGVDIKFCYDLAHSFTQYQKTSDIPKPPEALYEPIPAKYIYALHVGDYIPEKVLFHPPIHYEIGPLQLENWKNIGNIFRKKNVEVVIIETAARELKELENSYELMASESAYLKDAFGIA